ncbi:cytochrome-c oxidase, cbb3-type subunit III [Actibacterium sp.]|uniref:cytochrome-c oxidase, cbb3-type subunit III n=1 Tax=Actibacterium sp. TaxID=1872125 RepID=UPI0035676D54
MSTENKKLPGDVETTGHSWDGIEEFNNPLPRWWLWTFYACILYALVYTIAYPAWPLISGATPGVLGYSTRANVAADIAKFDAMNAPVEAKLVAAELTDITNTPELLSYSVNAGKAVFQTWCAQCHGSGAAGVQGAGYPNLLDDDWLWGGAIEDIHTTITHGIRNEQDPDARYSEMPKFGEILEPAEIAQVVQYVRTLSGQEADAALASAGETVFLDNCAACHADDGTGDRFQGAPNLTDAVWLYGGDVDTLTETVTNARFGVMPSWQARLSESDIRAVATYVHSLGGGE